VDSDDRMVSNYRVIVLRSVDSSIDSTRSSLESIMADRYLYFSARDVFSRTAISISHHPILGRNCACVACQNPCIDIDSERSYWDGLNKPETVFLRYSYIGLVVGYFGYYCC
jgi:hypothetical protein